LDNYSVIQGVTVKNTDVIDQLVRAYNAQDTRAFANLFTEDAYHGRFHTDAPQIGRETIYQHYIKVFAQHPQNQTKVINRMQFGPFVVDHEIVKRSPEAEPFEVIAVYTLEHGLIKRLEMVRE
jgi:hypothetical protein